MTTDKFQRVLNENLIIIYLDLDGNIIHANNRLFEISKYTEQEIIHKPYSKVIAISSPDVDLDDIRSGHTFKGVVKCKDACIQPTYLAMDIIPVEKDGKFNELLCVGIDITRFELKQKSKDKNIIVSRSKSMEKKLSDIAIMRQEILNLQKEIDKQELLIQKQQRTIQEVSEDNKKSKTVIQKLKSVSLDLPDVLLDLEISRCRRYNTPLSLVICDLDFFSDLEKNYPEDAIKEMFEAIKKKVSKIIRDTDYISIDNDSIFIILSNTNATQAEQFCEKVKEYFTDNKFHYKETLLTLSYGILEFNSDLDKVAFLSQASMIADDLKRFPTRANIKQYEMK
jgi:diguanylate cyclase (GGDEF)-like protein